MAVDRLVWKAAVTSAALLAGVIAKQVATAGWRRATGLEPPRNPAAPRTDWTAALGWAAASGLAVGVAKVLARQAAAEAWRRADGRYPAGLAATGGARAVE